MYNCSGTDQIEQYTKTTEKTAEYVGSKYTKGSNIRTAIETRIAFILDIPDDQSANASQTERFM